MSDAIGTAFIDIRAQWDDRASDREIDRGVNRIESDVGGGGRFRSAGASLGTKLVAGFGAVWAGGAALNIASDLIGDAQAIQAGMQMAEASFGPAIDRVADFGDGVNESFGVSDDRMLAMLGTTGDLLVGLGATSEQAATLATEGTNLAGILSLASGGTVDMTDASERLQAAMVGETDGLKALGIAISAADIEARLLAKGQGELTGEARRAAEAQAVLDIAYEQSAGKVQDYENGVFGAMEQQNELSAAWDTAKVTAGQFLNEGWLKLVDFVVSDVMPMWEELQPTVERVMERIGEVVESVLEFVQVLWGTFGDEIMAVVEFATGTIMARIEFALSIIQGVFETVTALLRGDWGAAWTGFSSIVTGAVGFIWAEVQRYFELILTFVGGIGGRVVEKAAGMWDGIWDAFRSVVNLVISGWNALEFTIPRMEIDPPGPLPSIGAGPWTFGVPDIPMLAQGGVIDAPTLALIGEDSRTTPEIVSPERLLRQIVREEAGAGLAGAPTVVVYIGDEQLEPRLVRVVDRQMGDLARVVSTGRR